MSPVQSVHTCGNDVDVFFLKIVNLHEWIKKRGRLREIKRKLSKSGCQYNKVLGSLGLPLKGSRLLLIFI